MSADGVSVSHKGMRKMDFDSQRIILVPKRGHCFIPLKLRLYVIIFSH